MSIDGLYIENIVIPLRIFPEEDFDPIQAISTLL
jgi:hypothetical protein